MIELVLYLSAVIILLAAVYSIKKQFIMLGIILITLSGTIFVYKYLNPLPKDIKKVIVTIDYDDNYFQIPDSLIEAAYQTEQLLDLKKDFSVLSLKNVFRIQAKKEVSLDSLASILKADYLVKISLVKDQFNVKINDDFYQLSSINEIKKILQDEFDLISSSTLRSSPALKLYLRNILNGQDSLNNRLSTNYLSMNDHYNLISNQDSSKSRNIGLNKLLFNLNKTSDYWWKKSGLKIRILLGLNDYNQAFDLIRAQRKFLDNRPEYFYLLSKFSYNRFKEFGYSNKFEIRRLAKEIIGTDLDLMAELAETSSQDKANIDAEKMYRTLVKIYPKSLIFRRQLGVIVSRSNRLEEAAKIFEQCLELDSNDWTVYYNLGIQYFWRDKAKAKETFKKAIDKGDTTNSFLFLGRLAYDEKDYRTAIVYFRERVKHETGHSDQNWLEALKGIRRCKSQLKIQDSLKVVGVKT